MLSRQEAYDLVNKYITKRNVIYHMLAVEAIMGTVAEHLGDDRDSWALVGLLHDIDYEKTESTPEKHSILTEQILNGLVSQEIIRAIKTHNYQNTGVTPESRMEKALISCDAISGLLIACALVMPSKKLADLKVETVTKKFKDKDFARGADRERILMCEQIGLSKGDFFRISLEGLKRVASSLEL